MKALDRKLLRDIVHLRWQAIAIALVVASGVASYVCVRGAWAGLQEACEAYYRSERMGDVFVHLERAPLSVARELEHVPGVTRVYPRIVSQALVPLETRPEPLAARLVSLPVSGPPPLLGLRLLQGVLPDPASTDQAVVNEAFAERHHTKLGERFRVVIEGNLREVRVTGIAMSPEFVLAQGGLENGDERLLVLWMPVRALASAFNLDGAFNDAVLSLDARAAEAAVLSSTDQMLNRYGGLGAQPRRMQASNYVVQGELSQLQSTATIMPAIFLLVAAFLLHTTLSRLVELQRSQIAVFKSVGYTNFEVGRHFMALALLVSATGAMLGVAAGGYLGDAMGSLYAEYFRFPRSRFSLHAQVAWTAVVVSLVAAAIGSLSSVRRVTRLAPAEAMRPQAPEVYRTRPLFRALSRALFEAPGKMVLRELGRRPVRQVFSIVGVAMAVGIVVVGRFQTDAIDFLMEQVFERAMREDVAVVFRRAVDKSALDELGRLPGIERVEGMRSVSVRATREHRHRDVVLSALPRGAELRRILDQHANLIAVPEDGALITDKLAEILGVRVGDEIELHVLEGSRVTKRVVVTALAAEMYGLNVYMTMDGLHRLLGEEPRVNVALLRVGPSTLPAVRARIATWPGVAAVTRRASIIKSFREQTSRSTRVMTAVLTLFGVIIAVGVVYNNARVTLSMRSRDLATLRVLGFTRREVSTVLAGEIATQLAIGIPCGLLFGRALSIALMSTVDAERYRWPVMISSVTYAFAAIVAIVTAAATWSAFSRRVKRLDLIAVLKTRE